MPSWWLKRCYQRHRCKSHLKREGAEGKVPAHERGGVGERQRKMRHNGAAPGMVFPLSSPWTPWLCKCQEAIRAWRTLSIYYVPGMPRASQGPLPSHFRDGKAEVQRGCGRPVQTGRVRLNSGCLALEPWLLLMTMLHGTNLARTQKTSVWPRPACSQQYCSLPGSPG